MKRGAAVAAALVVAAIASVATGQDRPAIVAPPAVAPAAIAPANVAPVPATTPPMPPLVQGAGRRAAQAAGSQGDVTPNAERDVTIGAINKRTGETRTFAGKPGQMFDFGSLHVTVRACETTPPWEQKLTGAFLLIDERLLRGGARRVYSGWMFAQSPSLHPLEHPRYDIWVKSCTMRFPETGPNTVVVGRAPAPGAMASSAKKSDETSSAEVN
jgi:hypothetical protein